VIVAFNVGTDEAWRALAEQRGVEIRRYDVIYNLTDDVKAMLAGRLKSDQRTVELGRAACRGGGGRKGQKGRKGVNLLRR
jgi:translation initiation factor IF-2